MQSTNGSTKRYRGVYFDPKTGMYFYSVVTGKQANGRPKRQLKRGYKTAKEADRARRDVLKALETGNFVELSKETLGEFMASWLEANKATLRFGTWRSYEGVVRLSIVPYLGHVPLQQLTPDQLNALYGKLLAKGLAPGTVGYTHALIYGALDDAQRWGRVLRNVAALANPPRRRSGKSTVRTWTKEEMGRFLSHVREDRLYPAFMLAATTGMRRGEVLGIAWPDVDLDAARVSVRRTLVAVAGEVMESEPKTDSGRRTVPIPAETVQALRVWKLRQEPTVGDYVFTDKAGKPYHPGYFSKWFEARAKAAGVPRIRFHDLRHTWATLALQAGIPLKVVSEILGHRNIAITADLYSHVAPSMMEEASNAVAGLIFG